MVDVDYKFIYVDVGCQGRIGDAGVYFNSTLCTALVSNSLNIPQPELIPGNNVPFPYVFGADEAFPLKTFIMKPFARRGLIQMERIFNYRLSRARRIVENAFGILASRFRVFRGPTMMGTATAEKVVLAATVPHTFMRHHFGEREAFVASADFEDQEGGEMIPGEWRSDGSSRGSST